MDTLSKQCGRGAGRKSTVAHASQRMVTVCALTSQEPVKYVLSAKQLLSAQSLTVWMRAHTCAKESVRQKIFNESFMGPWLCSKQTGQSSWSNKRNLLAWPEGSPRQQQVNRAAARVNKDDMKREAQIRSRANIRLQTYWMEGSKGKQWDYPLWPTVLLSLLSSTPHWSSLFSTAHTWGSPFSCVASVVACGNRLATLTGCMAEPGRQLQSADVAVTSDPRPGATLKGLLSLWGHPQMGTEALNVISRLHMCTVNIYKPRMSIWQLYVTKWASVSRSLVN